MDEDNISIKQDKYPGRKVRRKDYVYTIRVT